MTEDQLFANESLWRKLGQEKSRQENKGDAFVTPDEPFFEEIKELISQKRQEYIDRLQKEFDSL